MTIHDYSRLIVEDLDYIIVGQGIAGSLLGYELLRRGLRVRVIDDGHCSSASKVAAGILNPITGQRLVKSGELEKFLTVARLCYRELEGVLGVSFFHQREILRLFKNDYEVEQYEKRKLEGGYGEYLGECFGQGAFGDELRDAHGSFIIKEAANLDTKIFLSALRDFFRSNGLIKEEVFDYAKVGFDGEIVFYKGIRAKKIVFCEGYKVFVNPWFKDLKWEPAKGEILTVKVRDVLPDKIINCGKWLMPIGEGFYKAGASYNWERFDNEVTEEGRRDVVGGLCADILVSDEFEVVGQEAGVRSCTKDTQAYIGLDPKNQCLGIFNGFGSKGTLLVPYYARQFVDFLEGGGELDRDVLVERGNIV